MKSDTTDYIKSERIDYGFEWGAAKVERFCSDEKKGWVLLGITTPKHRLQVYVTKTGKVRVHDGSGEWKPSDNI
jgi:hypothetical protein